MEPENYQQQRQGSGVSIKHMTIRLMTVFWEIRPKAKNRPKINPETIVITQGKYLWQDHLKGHGKRTTKTFLYDSGYQPTHFTFFSLFFIG